MKRLMSRPFPPIVLTDHCTLIRLPTKISATAPRTVWSQQHPYRRVACEHARYRERPFLPTPPQKLTPLATALVVVATRNRPSARDDAIAVHEVVLHYNILQVCTVRAARVGCAHPDPLNVVTKGVASHRGVLRVANVDATTPFSLAVAVKLVVFEQGLVRAVLVADPSAVTVDYHAVVYPEAIIPGRIVGAASIAPEAIPLLIVHVHSTCFELGYPLDDRCVEAE
jgi:hypothetical protein